MSDSGFEKEAKRKLRLAAVDGVALVKAPTKRKRKTTPKGNTLELIAIQMGVTRGELLRSMSHDLVDYRNSYFKPIASVASILRKPLRQLRATVTTGSVLEVIIDLLEDRNLDVAPKIAGLMDFPLFLTRRQIAEIAGGSPGNLIRGSTCARTLKQIAARTL